MDQWNNSSSTRQNIASLEVLLTLVLLLVQTLRRLLECLYVTRHSQRKMHMIHYVLGLYFYTAVGPTAMLHLHHTGECIYIFLLNIFLCKASF